MKKPHEHKVECWQEFPVDMNHNSPYHELVCGIKEGDMIHAIEVTYLTQELT